MNLGNNMAEQHPFIDKLKSQLAKKEIGRRDFLRTATLLGLSASLAFEYANNFPNNDIVSNANAAAINAQNGGSLRFAIRVQDYKFPHKYSWYESEIARQVIEHLTRTDEFGVTHPYLLEKFTPSSDLKTWTLILRKNIKWRKGRDFVADDVIWNLKRVLDPATGSSVFGLLSSALLDEKEMHIWSDNAIQKIDNYTIKLNLRQPTLAIPEYLYHYAMHIMDPEENGEFFVGCNGTGPFELTEIKIGERAILKARKSGYWGIQPQLDEVICIDLGDDRAAHSAAFQSKQIDGAYDILPSQTEIIKKLPNFQIYNSISAATGVMGMNKNHKPFDKPEVRKALRLAINNEEVTKVATFNYGVPAEHHHVAPVHPEYAKLPEWKTNQTEAKKLLAKAGYPNGFTITLDMKGDQEWETNFAQIAVSQLKEIGVNLKLNVMPAPVFWGNWTKSPFGLVGWGHRPLGTMIYNLVYKTGVPWNHTQYSNKEFDKLLDLAQSSPDVAKRSKIMAKLEKILQEDGPVIQSFWRPVLTAMDKRIMGYNHHPSSYFYFNELAFSNG